MRAVCSRGVLAAVTVALSVSVAVAQNAAAPASIQPVPGAMPNSDTVPSTLSPKNAQDDALPIAAFRLNDLTDQQRQAIYRAVMANRSAGKATDAPVAQLALGTVLPQDTPLQPLPKDVASGPSDLSRVSFQVIGNQVVLADPLNRAVLAVIAPSSGGDR
jgi:hypothetical protein